MKKKLCMISVLLSIVLICAVLCMNHQFALIRLVYASGENNDIQFVEVHQYNGSAWNLVDNFTSSGDSCRVHDGWATNFTVSIKFNSTLASSTTEARNYTRVYMNISESIWTDKELNNTSCSLVGSFYILEEQGHWNSTGKPESGVTYECSVLYQGYY